MAMLISLLCCVATALAVFIVLRPTPPAFVFRTITISSLDASATGMINVDLGYDRRLECVGPGTRSAYQVLVWYTGEDRREIARQSTQIFSAKKDPAGINQHAQLPVDLRSIYPPLSPGEYWLQIKAVSTCRNEDVQANVTEMVKFRVL